MIRRVTEQTLALLTEASACDRALDLGFGPSGAWLLDTPENEWAFALLDAAEVES